MSYGSTVASPVRSAHPRSSLTPCALHGKLPQLASVLALELRCATCRPVISTSTTGGPWFGLALLGESFGLLAQLLYRACERLLAELQVSHLARVQVREAGGKRLGARLPQHPADHPADVALQPADDPLATAGDVGENLREDLRAGFPDLLQLRDARERDHTVADQLLRASRELKQLDPGADPSLRSAERLHGTVLGQAARSHRLQRERLLVRVQLLARHVVDRSR